MNRWWKMALVAGVAVLAPAIVLAGGDAAKGKVLFTSKCVSCHGPDGEGKPAIAKMMKVEMRPLGSKEVQAKNDATLRKNIDEGTGKMKPVKLTDEEATNVIAFVRTLAKK
jgi:mono/diheme cytochrome c family protein